MEEQEEEELQEFESQPRVSALVMLVDGVDGHTNDLPDVQDHAPRKLQGDQKLNGIDNKTKIRSRRW